MHVVIVEKESLVSVVDDQGFHIEGHSHSSLLPTPHFDKDLKWRAIRIL